MKQKITENIFDLTDVSDIPEEISSELVCDNFAQNILKLFELAGRNLTIDEITVGYYRQFNEIKTKRQIMGKHGSQNKKMKKYLNII